MLHAFLEHHRSELLDRCETKVAARSRSRSRSRSLELGPALEVDWGLAPFLQQLIESLRAGEVCGETTGCGSRAAPGTKLEGLRAAALQHGAEALRRGLPIDHVVREYCDLSQAVSELVAEHGAAVPAAELQALHLCLERASAEAVGEFDRQRQQMVAETQHRAIAERVGFLAHELRNFLSTAMLSFAAIRSGSVAVNGATAAVLDRSLGGLRDLIARSLEDVRLVAIAGNAKLEEIAVDALIANIQVAAGLDAGARDCEFLVAPVAPGLTIRADRQLLNSAVSNLLQNAFKFNRPNSAISLRTLASGERVLIEVEDCCGGLPVGKADELFGLFAQHHPDRSGLGLGLSISRRAVECCGGTLSVRDIPGKGCVFTIDLPRVDPGVSAGDADPAYVSLRTDRAAALG